MLKLCWAYVVLHQFIVTGITLTTYRMRTKRSVVILLLFVFAFCKQAKKSAAKQPVQPPSSLVNVPFKEFSVRAETGDTLAYKSSIIFFPPNSFVDKTGKIITGNLQVKYRELNDPLDFYISGTPMNYDSAGVRYNFESIAMCELLAYQHGQPVFVNQASRPEITMRERNGAGGNVYFFDTTARNWVYKGKDERDPLKLVYDMLGKGRHLK